MNTVTHALMPVVLAKTCLGKDRQPKRWAWFALMVAGAAPDLINPHIYLEDRMTSWSHGLPAWFAFTVLLFIASLLKKLQLHRSLAAMMSFAYLLHIACDLISGGLNPLYPFAGRVLGDYWVGLVWWIPIDIVLLLTCYYHFRVKVLWAARKRSKA